jgi:large subunit ribosomal protein L23
MEFTRIIIRPMHTEKTYAFQAMETKKYAFYVDPKATKHDIALAFESIYGIKPTKVATQIRKPAKIRTGTAKPGFSKLTKIAYVSLPIGSDISAQTATAETPKVETPVKVEKKSTSKITSKEVVKKETTAKVEEKKTATESKPKTIKKTATKKEVVKKEVKE